MDITVNNKIKIVRWHQEVTLKTIRQFELTLKQLIESTETMLILDLTDVVYMNSAGLGMLVDTALNAKKQNKQFVLVGIVNPLLEIFNIVKINVIIKCFENQNEAINYYLYKKNSELRYE